MKDYRQPITELSGELANYTGKQPPGYRKLYGLILDGRLPVERVSGRYYFRRDDIPTISEIVGLTQATDKVRT